MNCLPFVIVSAVFLFGVCFCGDGSVCGAGSAFNLGGWVGVGPTTGKTHGVGGDGLEKGWSSQGNISHRNSNVNMFVLIVLVCVLWDGGYHEV